MKPWCALLLAFTLACSSCSTTTPAHKAHSEPTLADAFSSAPLYTAAMLTNGPLDLIYCCWSFRSKSDRWPKDYRELSTYVAHSNGYLILADHPGAQLKPLPNDALEIIWVPRGQTNELKITLSSPGPRL